MNKEHIIKFWKMLRHEKQTELRAINPETKEVKNYHFNSEEQLLKLCEDFDGKYNLYLGVNERNEFGTRTEDVIKIKIIPIDIDCINKPATDEDIMIANQITMQIIIDGQKQGFQKPVVSLSGNGYQIFFCIPEIVITKDNRESVEEKIREFERRLIDKYSNEKVRLDQVGDLPRIMRITGTYNLKSKTYSQLINEEYLEDSLLKEYILSLELSKGIIIGGLTPELKDKIKGDNIIQKLFEGDLIGKPSRSEAELSLICRLVQIGLNKEQIFRIMASCKIGKWQQANISYRELSYRKAIELITTERIKQINNPSLSDLYLVYNKWLWIEDTKRIDLVLAHYLTKFMEGTPIWLIIVGNSSDGKSEQIMTLKDMPDFFIAHNWTARTLVTGDPKTKDLAPELDGKYVVFPDMAQLLQLAPQDKAELWAQLRDLYDGYAGKDSGKGKRARYDNLRITLIGCSTPKIDSQILVHQDLGTRELIYRTEEILDDFSLMKYAMRNEEEEAKMKKELKEITFNFLKDKRPIKRELTLFEEEELQNIALFIAKVRASAEYDSQTNELRNNVYPERPARIVKQLKRIYIALMSLEKDYSSDKAFQILWHLGKSCAFPVRISIFEYFIRDFLNKKVVFEYTTTKIANDVKIGKGTAKRELHTLWNMGIINKTEAEEGNRWNPTEYWRLNLTNDFIESYLRFLSKSSVMSQEMNGGSKSS